MGTDTMEYIPTIAEVRDAGSLAEERREQDLASLAELAYADAGAGFDPLD